MDEGRDDPSLDIPSDLNASSSNCSSSAGIGLSADDPLGNTTPFVDDVSCSSSAGFGPSAVDPLGTVDSSVNNDFFEEINAIDLDFDLDGDFPGDDLVVDHGADGPRALIDTSAYASCTHRRDWLHHYTEFTESNPSPIHLKPATDGSDATPVGFGYLHVPARNSRGYLAVRTVYSPVLRTTVINDLDISAAAGHKYRDMESAGIIWQFELQTCTYLARHRLKRSFDVVVEGIKREGKPFTDLLLLPFHGKASITQLSASDPDFVKDVDRATLQHVHLHHRNVERDLSDQLKSLPALYSKALPYHDDYIHRNTPVNAIRKETERLLWHQRLGHPSDYYLYQAHRHIKGVPVFKHVEPILASCPTCIRAKQTKNSAGPNSTRKATVPYQGLSIDFAFAGTASKTSTRATQYVGLNGETCWILITDHFSRKKIGSTRVSKAAPLSFLRQFLCKHAPKDRSDNYVYLDQGGELYANPTVRALFAEFD